MYLKKNTTKIGKQIAKGFDEHINNEFL